MRERIMINENPRYTVEVDIPSKETEKADLIKAVMHRHTKYAFISNNGFYTHIFSLFYSDKNAEIAKKEIVERFFN